MSESKNKLQVQFVIGDPSTECFVQFKDEIDKVDIGDWFARVSQGIQQVFNTFPYKLGLNIVHNPNKIDSIKLVRELTRCGLKEAKDAVEGHAPHIMILSSDAPAVMKRFSSIGSTVEKCPLGPNATTMTASNLQHR